MSEPISPFNPAGFIPVDTTPEIPLELRMDAERIEWESQQSNNAESEE
jgi:hypothetical protein